jgi:hypothetical protein
MDLPEENNPKFQELSIIISDLIRSIDKRWWYALAAVFVLCFPFYFAMRTAFVSAIVGSHKFPAYIYQDQAKVPLEVTEKKIFSLGNNTYNGYIKIKNSANFQWGAAAQGYTAAFSTTGGTQVSHSTGMAFVLPASEKIIVFKSFQSDKAPTVLDIKLEPTQFTHKPTRAEPDLGIERKDLIPVGPQLVVAASIKNKTPFTIKRIGLPVLLYDGGNNIVGANYTNIDEVLYGESRSFQVAWPNHPAAVRAEILPEINLFDSGIYKLPPSGSQFDTQAIP